MHSGKGILELVGMPLCGIRRSRSFGEWFGVEEDEEVPAGVVAVFVGYTFTAWLHSPCAVFFSDTPPEPTLWVPIPVVRIVVIGHGSPPILSPSATITHSTPLFCQLARCAINMLH